MKQWHGVGGSVINLGDNSEEDAVLGEMGSLSMGSLHLRNTAIVQCMERKKTVNCHYQQDFPSL